MTNYHRQFSEETGSWGKHKYRQIGVPPADTEREVLSNDNAVALLPFAVVSVF